MRPTVSLLVDALDIYDANLLDAFGDQVDLRPDQVRDVQRLGTWHEADRYTVAFAQQLVGAVLDCLQSILREVRQKKVHTRSIRVHLAAGHGRTVELVDHAAHRVQCGVVAHQRVAPLPVDVAMDCAARLGRISLETMDHERSALADFDDARRTAVPAERSEIVWLPTPGGVERRPIQNHPAIGQELHNPGVERAQIGVRCVQQVRVGHSLMVQSRSAATCCRRTTTRPSIAIHQECCGSPSS